MNIYDPLFQYMTSLIDTPYKLWHINGCQDQFWNEDAPHPSPEIVRSGSCCCAGVTNLMRRFMKLPIPYDPEVKGGTRAYFNHFKPHLKPFTKGTKYPKGTLLLRNYYDENDQGHVAVMYDDGGTILQCSFLSINDSCNESLIKQKSTKEDCSFLSISDSHNGSKIKQIKEIKEGINIGFNVDSDHYLATCYTHICDPEIWLS